LSNLFIIEVSSPKEKKEIIGNSKWEKLAENSEIFTYIFPWWIEKKITQAVARLLSAIRPDTVYFRNN
jgi:hypothetical protein